jgi:hypothetical protein
MAISLVASTEGVALLPVYALNFLPRSVSVAHWSVFRRGRLTPVEG